MKEDVYLRLRDFLDTLPGGFPTTESGVEIRILKKLFTPEQAHIAMQFGKRPKTVSAIAPKLGMDEPQAAEKLESMAKDGLLFRVRDGNKTFYTALQFFAGIYEFHLNTLDRELSEMLEEYFPYLAKVWESTKTKQFRVVPIGSSVNAAPTVSTYDQIRELVKGKELISVAPCICQKRAITHRQYVRSARRTVHYVRQKRSVLHRQRDGPPDHCRRTLGDPENGGGKGVGSFPNKCQENYQHLPLLWLLLRPAANDQRISPPGRPCAVSLPSQDRPGDLHRMLHVPGALSN